MKNDKNREPKEESRRRSKRGDYESLFFKEANIKTRNGSAVYIRKEYHQRIMKIIRVIGEDEISLFSYLDNVLKHHFDQFQDDMARAYNQKNKDEFFNK